MLNFKVEVRFFGNLLVHEGVTVLIIVVVMADVTEAEIPDVIFKRHPEDPIIDHSWTDSEVKQIGI